MTLPDMILPSRVNQRWLYSGMDSLELCFNRQHFQTYPYTVDYVYNSRGFRDQEWPDSELELRNAIWCIGDSFTAGVGQPLAHIWPQVLATVTARRSINISMDGASNDWIWRRAQDIWTAVRPRHMVIMWSYTHRRELPDSTLSDEARMLRASRASMEQDLVYWKDLVNYVHSMSADIVQCTIPEFSQLALIDLDAALAACWQAVKGKDWPTCPRTLAEFEGLPEFVIHELKEFHGCYNNVKHLLLQHCADAESSLPVAILPDVIHVDPQLDWARDHHHFDILTAQWVVDQILPRLTA